VAHVQKKDVAMLPICGRCALGLKIVAHAQSEGYTKVTNMWSECARSINIRHMQTQVVTMLPTCGQSALGLKIVAHAQTQDVPMFQICGQIALVL
jgi:hypothetical protein